MHSLVDGPRDDRGSKNLRVKLRCESKPDSFDCTPGRFFDCDLRCFKHDGEGGNPSLASPGMGVMLLAEMVFLPERVILLNHYTNRGGVCQLARSIARLDLTGFHQAHGMMRRLPAPGVGESQGLLKILSGLDPVYPFSSGHTKFLRLLYS